MAPLIRDALVVRLAQAMDLVRQYRESRAVSRATKALLKAADALFSTRETRARADDVRTVAASLAKAQRPGGDRWALARELEVLHADGVPSYRVTRALFHIGCCFGQRRPQETLRCASWARSERRRWRDSLRRPTRQFVDPAFHVPEPALRSSPGTQPEETNMGKVLKRTTTVTEEVLDKEDIEGLDDHEDDDESDDEADEEEHDEKKPRRPRRR
jgi:hypothetical protein